VVAPLDEADGGGDGDDQESSPTRSKTTSGANSQKVSGGFVRNGRPCWTVDSAAVKRRAASHAFLRSPASRPARSAVAAV
jgi:hypothetical protein